MIKIDNTEKEIKILFFTYNYKPEIAANIHLASDLVEDLAKNGCVVEVITPIPTRGVSKKTTNQYKTKKRELLNNGKIIINRINPYLSDGGSYLKRVFRSIIAILGIFIKALLIKGDIVFTYSTPPTLGLIGILIGKLKRIPVIYNLQDIFPDSLINSGLIKKSLTGKFLLGIGRLIERITYKYSDKIVVISEDFKKTLLSRGVPAKKIELIYNWIDTDKVVPIERKDNALIKRYNLDPTHFYVSYCGNIGLTQNLEMLINVAKELEYINDLRFLIIGDGAYKNILIEYAKKKSVTNVLLLPFQPYGDISHVYSLGDVGLIISKRNIGKNSFPSKTWSIMSAERSVLASFDVDSELCSIIRKAHCGVYVPADNKEALKEAVLELYNNREKLKKLGRNSRQYILENLTREKGTSKIKNILYNIVSG